MPYARAIARSRPPRCAPARPRLTLGAGVLLTLLAGTVALGCSPSRDSGTATPSTEEKESAPAEEQVAYFAGGCFWGVEHFMEQINGVKSVESGYMGGHVDDPSYEQVASQTSGHVETVRVRYDPTRTNYKQIAKRFFEIHDPTQANGQGPDIGPEYLSVVFYRNEDEKRATEELIGQLVERGYDVVTELRPASRFWEAEAFHQDYYERKGSKPYCHALVRRFDR